MADSPISYGRGRPTKEREQERRAQGLLPQLRATTSRAETRSSAAGISAGPVEPFVKHRSPKPHATVSQAARPAKRGTGAPRGRPPKRRTGLPGRPRKGPVVGNEGRPRASSPPERTQLGVNEDGGIEPFADDEASEEGDHMRENRLHHVIDQSPGALDDDDNEEDLLAVPDVNALRGDGLSGSGRVEDDAERSLETGRAIHTWDDLDIDVAGLLLSSWDGLPEERHLGDFMSGL
ncbi:hypothetical protein PG985_005283 [Apiospora marii]|uniref:Uncharacterized protein n=1 Tax=Apiospora marii TaxID=335849 RepID=A0ABR1SBK8_9PEZI